MKRKEKNQIARKQFMLSENARKEFLKEKTRLQNLKPDGLVTWSDTLLKLIAEARKSRASAK